MSVRIFTNMYVSAETLGGRANNNTEFGLLSFTVAANIR